MNLDTIVSQTKKLLPNPQILPKLLSVLEDANSDASDIVKLVKVDPGLTAQIISVSNGAYYGFSEPCTELEEAVNRVGFQELFKLVSLCLCRSVGGKAVTNYYLDEGALWENAVTTGVIMESLSSDFELPTGLSYTVGLLHSLGKFVINQLDGDVYESVYQEIERNNLTLIEAEKAVLGFDHAEACDALLKNWDYPQNVREPIACQYEPARSEEFTKITYCLHFTKFLVTSVGCNFGRDAMAIELDPMTLDVLNLSKQDLALYTIKVQERLEEVQGMLNAVKGR